MKTPLSRPWVVKQIATTLCLTASMFAVVAWAAPSRSGLLPSAPSDVPIAQTVNRAKINFTDGSSLTTQSHSHTTIDAYLFLQVKPNADYAFVRQLTNVLRTVTGVVAKPRNQDADSVDTNQVTIGIRGSLGLPRWA